MIQFDEHIFQMGWFNHGPSHESACFMLNQFEAVLPQKHTFEVFDCVVFVLMEIWMENEPTFICLFFNSPWDC